MDVYKTPMHKTPLRSKVLIPEKPIAMRSPLFPSHVQKYATLKTKAQAVVDRFIAKTRGFERKIGMIENLIANGLRKQAQMALNDVKKDKEESSECLEEVCFIVGDTAKNLEEKFDGLFCVIGKFRMRLAR